MSTLYARGNCVPGTTVEDAWKGFAYAFKDLPVPGQPLLSVPDGAPVSAGSTYESSKVAILLEQWDPPRGYTYTVKDSNGDPVSRLAITLGVGKDGVYFKAEMTRHGWLSRRRVSRELQDRFGTTGRKATAYWGPWLRLPLVRSDLRVSD